MYTAYHYSQKRKTQFSYGVVKTVTLNGVARQPAAWRFHTAFLAVLSFTHSRDPLRCQTLGQSWWANRMGNFLWVNINKANGSMGNSCRATTLHQTAHNVLTKDRRIHHLAIGTCQKGMYHSEQIYLCSFKTFFFALLFMLSRKEHVG